MGTGGIRTHVKNGKGDKLSVPPGFVSLTSFTLSRVENSEEICSSTALGTESEPEQVQVDISCSITDSSMLGRALRGRPWIRYDQSTHNPEEHESEQLDTNRPSKTCLPKGVIRGCPSCSNCQKVIARWHPESAWVTSLEEAPVFRPSEEEFKDLLKYVASIRPKAESYGICRIVPPPSWQPPCLLKEKNIWESSKFKTSIQRINELQRVYSDSKLEGINEKVTGKKRKILGMSLERGSGEGCTTDQDQAGYHAEPFEFEPGPEFTLETFKKYADDFKWQYFCMKGKDTDVDDDSLAMLNHWKPSVKTIEGEYRRNVENPSEEIEAVQNIIGRLKSAQHGV